MPSLKIDDLDKILNLLSKNRDKFTYFVETGTYHGDTIIEMSNYFDKLYTIELSNNLYEQFQQKNYNKEKIKSILGDSSEKISEVITELQSDTIFFLDGHFSSCGTAKGSKDVPLIEELLVINELFHKESIIIIDDFRLFNTNFSEDWTEITLDSVRNVIKNRIVKEIIVNDRLVFNIR